VSGGITIGNADLRLRVADGDGNIVPTAAANQIFFACASQVSAVSLTTVFNSFFTTNNIKATAAINSSGQLEFTSTETGTDARISIFQDGNSGAGSMAPLGFITGQAASGTG